MDATNIDRHVPRCCPSFLPHGPPHLDDGCTSVDATHPTYMPAADVSLPGTSSTAAAQRVCATHAGLQPTLADQVPEVTPPGMCYVF